METPVKDRSHWKVRKFTSFDEMRRQQILDWQEAGSAKRMQAAWELVCDYWVGIKKMNPDDLRLQKTVVHVRRSET